MYILVSCDIHLAGDSGFPERLPNWLTVNILHTEGIVGKLKRDAKIFGVTSAEKGV